MNLDPRLIEVFFEVQRGLPRQGPGDNASTLRAFRLCSELADRPTILDIGCGPGMQTIALAQASSGRIMAVDTCDEYLDQLRHQLRHAGLTDRVEAIKADMTALDLPNESVDLIWCEAAIYIMGVSAALEAWRSLLRHHGCLVFSELVWLEDNPPEPVAAFWQGEYPAMMNVPAIEDTIGHSGYALIDTFTLPDAAWWVDYYTPLEDKLPQLRQKYENDNDALNIIASTETEIEMRRSYGTSYGYQFFVLRAR